jgi:RHS repeat-associated protein
MRQISILLILLIGYVGVNQGLAEKEPFGRWHLYNLPAKLIDDSPKEKTKSLDCVQYTFWSDKDSIAINEEVELKIQVSYIKGLEAYQTVLQGCNQFVIKVIIPNGFVLSGGDYSDFMPLSVDAKNPSRLITLKGYFKEVPTDACFRLLRGPINIPPQESLFLLKASKCVAVSINPTTKNKDFFVIPAYATSTEGNFKLLNVIPVRGSNLDFEMSLDGKTFQKLGLIRLDDSHLSGQVWIRNTTQPNQVKSIPFDFLDVFDSRRSSVSSARVANTSAYNLNIQLLNSAHCLHSEVRLQASQLPADVAGRYILCQRFFKFVNSQNTYFTVVQLIPNTLDITILTEGGGWSPTTSLGCSDTEIYSAVLTEPFVSLPILASQIVEKSNVITIPKPPSPTVTGPTLVRAGNNFTLSATGCGTGASVRWYRQQTINGDQLSLTYVGAGSSLTTSIADSTTFQVLCDLNNNATLDLCECSAAYKVYTRTCNLSISPALNTICNGQSLTLTSATCATGITWSTGSTNRSITVSPTQNTTYTLSCPNCINTTATATVTVNTIPAAPFITNPTVSLPTGSTVNLSVSGCFGGTVRWSTGASGRFLTVNQPGNYTAFCEQNNCRSIASNTARVTSINCTQSLSVTPSATQVCAGQSVTLTASACDGALSWSVAGATTPSITITPVAGVGYNVTCSKSGCPPVSAPQTTIDVRSIPSSPFVSSLTGTQVVAGTPVTLLATGCLDGQVLWSNGQTGTSITVIPTAGVSSYSAICQANWGCNSPTSNVLNLTANCPAPTLDATATQVCSGSASTLTAGGCPGVLNWSTGAGNQPSITVNPTVSTTYSVTCTVAGSGCSPIVRSIAINVPSAPPTTPSLTASAATICPGVSVNLSASNCNGIIVWSTGQTGNSIKLAPSATTTYTAYCQVQCANSPNVSVTVNVIQTNIPVVSASTNQPVCPGTSVTLTATGCSGTVNWSNGSTGASIQVSPSVTTSYTATCATTCGVSAASTARTVTVVALPTVPTISASSTLVCANSTVTLTATGCTNGTPYWSASVSGVLSTNTGTTVSATLTNQPVTFQAMCSGPCGSSLPSNPIIVSIRAATPTPTISANKTSTCAGGSVSLSAAGCGSGTVIWSTDQTGPTLSVSPTATTTYTATCRGICGEGNASQPLTVTVITNPAIPSITASRTTICQGGSATLTATGCVGTVTWSDGRTGNSIMVTPTFSQNTFSATCLDACGIQRNTNQIAFTILTFQPSPTISASTTSVCAGGAATLTATGCDGTVQWSNNASGASITVNPTTNTSYSARCFGSCGTSTYSSGLMISILPPPSVPFITPVSASICRGTSRTLNANGCSGGTVTWSNGAVGASITVTPTATTTYSATCTTTCGTSAASAAVTLTVNGSGPPTLSATKTSVYVGQTTQLSASGCPGTVNWSNGRTGNPITLTATAAGSLSYTATCLVSGCTSAASAALVVNVYACDFSLLKNPDQPDLIIGNSLGLKAQRGPQMSPAAFSWSASQTKQFVSDPANPALNTSTATGDSVRVMPSVTGTVTFTVRAADNPTCSVTLSVLVKPFPCACTDCDLPEVARTDLPSVQAGWQGSPLTNYVIENTHLSPTGSSVLGQITYFDGLGRPIQQTSLQTGGYALKDTNNRSDVVRYMAYDALGREPRQYLPFASASNGGLFRPGDLSGSIAGYYASIGKDGGNPYAETVFEYSPLSRVIRQAAAGMPGMVQIKYRTNTTGEVKGLAYNFDTGRIEVYTYQAAQLSVVESTNPLGQVSLEYTDKDGQVVAKNVAGRWTHYAYDDLGRLRCVVPPQHGGVLSQPSFDAFAANDLLFAYDYDARGRVSRKKIPGMAGPILMLYNERDLLVRSTDPKGNVSEMVYDALNRPTQTTINGTLMSEQWYDTYAGVGFDQTHAFGQALLPNPTGQPTGSRVAQLNPQDNSVLGYLTTSLYYDALGRLIQTAAEHHKGGVERSSSQLDFVGKALQTRLSSHNGLEIRSKNAYDRGQRLKATCQQISDPSLTQPTWEPVARYHRNGIGDLTLKTLGCSLQQVHYRYYLAGWLKDINNPDELNPNATKEKDLFGLSLGYDALGNITSSTYQYARTNSQTRAFEPRGLYTQAYTYDDLNRLSTSSLAKAGVAVFTNQQTYNDNGNILSLQRSLNGSVVDNLSYTYKPNSNQIDRVEDSGTAAFFENKNANSTDYTYDENGNTTQDLNRGIGQMSYNALNLLRQVVANGQTTTYTYTGAGQKLQANFGQNKKYDYLSAGVWRNDTLEFVPTTEGRFVPKQGALSTGRYEYHLQDQLGNLRLACACKPDSGTVVIQETHYDAWGLELPVGVKGDNRFLFTGKETQPETGYIDFGARQYDASVPRFLGIDPLAENGRRWSPYVYGFDNPIRFIDPDGRWPWPSWSEMANKAKNYVVNKAVETVTNAAVATVNYVKNEVKEVLKNTEVAVYGKAEVKLTTGAGGATEVKGYGVDARYKHVELLQGELNVDSKKGFTPAGNYASKNGETKTLNAASIGVPSTPITSVEVGYEQETIKNSTGVIGTKTEFDGGGAVLTPIGLPAGAGVKLSRETGTSGNIYEARGEMIRTGAKIGTPFTFSFDVSIGVRATYTPKNND